MKNTYYLIFYILFFQSNIFAQWQIQNINSNEDLNSIFFKNEMLGWIAASGGIIFKTSDGGTVWIAHYLGNNYDLNSVYFTSDSVGFATDNNNIFKSEDSGLSWNIIKSDNTELFSKIYFFNNEFGFILGKSSIYKTTNSGNDWIEKDIDTVDIGQIIGITFKDHNIGWLAFNTYVGWGGTFYKTTNGGETWNKISNIPGDAGLSSFAGFVGTEILYAGRFMLGGGITYNLYKSTNEGITWNELGAQVASEIFFISPDTGWTIGQVGIHTHHTLLQRTTDGGQNFTDDQSLDTCHIYSIFVFNNNLGWAVGSGGSVLKYNNLTDIQVSSLNSFQYKLDQNYPNPFNPSTFISFVLPQAENVLLKVFDVLGNEVATLVSEFKQAGEYSIEFNGSNLSSGIYFYQIFAGDFSQTKKFVLIK